MVTLPVPYSASDPVIYLPKVLPPLALLQSPPLPLLLLPLRRLQHHLASAQEEGVRPPPYMRPDQGTFGVRTAGDR